MYCFDNFVKYEYKKHENPTFFSKYEYLLSKILSNYSSVHNLNLSAFVDYIDEQIIIIKNLNILSNHTEVYLDELIKLAKYDISSTLTMSLYNKELLKKGIKKPVTFEEINESIKVCFFGYDTLPKINVRNILGIKTKLLFNKDNKLENIIFEAVNDLGTKVTFCQRSGLSVDIAGANFMDLYRIDNYNCRYKPASNNDIDSIYYDIKHLVDSKEHYMHNKLVWYCNTYIHEELIVNNNFNFAIITMYNNIIETVFPGIFKKMYDLVNSLEKHKLIDHKGRFHEIDNKDIAIKGIFKEAYNTDTYEVKRDGKLYTTNMGIKV